MPPLDEISTQHVDMTLNTTNIGMEEIAYHPWRRESPVDALVVVDTSTHAMTHNDRAVLSMRRTHMSCH